MIAIEVTDDGTEEPEEVFLVYLEIVHISDGDEENLDPATRVTVAKIRLDNDSEYQYFCRIYKAMFHTDIYTLF